MYAKAAKKPEPSASKAYGSTDSKLGETISTIPVNAVITRAITEGCTFSAIILPESNATNKGAVYCKVTA